MIFGRRPAIGELPAKPISRIARRISYALLVCLAILTVLTILHFPRDTDATAYYSSAAENDYQAFYDDSYAPADNSTNRLVQKSYRVRKAPAALPQDPNLPLIRSFVEQYHLQHSRVLDVGAGAGGLQDAVEDYTGLDMARTAQRFFHKPFVVGSATSLPFKDNEFDVIWTIFVLEHVQKPEAALREMRRVLKPGGLLFLYPDWYCRPWAAQGYAVRPYRDFDLKGMLVKASIPIRDSIVFRSLYTFPIRFIRLSSYFLPRKPTTLRYNALTPNYSYHWTGDSDAVNSTDPYEVILWFRSRGDECLNFNTQLKQFLVRGGPLVFRIKKAGSPGNGSR